MKCSFCSKPNTEVKCIVAANDKIGICDECVIDALKIVVYGEPKPIEIDVTPNAFIPVYKNKNPFEG